MKRVGNLGIKFFETDDKNKYTVDQIIVIIKAMELIDNMCE